MPKTAARNLKCLMIEAEDRRYFTREEHLPQLLEFCKSFDMAMSIVNAQDAVVTDIADLPKALCEGKTTPKVQFEVLKKVLPFDASTCIPLVRTRSQILETAKSVRAKIHERFSKGEAMSRDMLEEEFPDSSITQATFMQHVRTARKDLEAKGYQFERISPGCYRSITPEQQQELKAEKEALAASKPSWTKFKTTHSVLSYGPTPSFELGKAMPHYVKPNLTISTVPMDTIDQKDEEAPEVVVWEGGVDDSLDIDEPPSEAAYDLFKQSILALQSIQDLHGIDILDSLAIPESN